MKSLIAIATLLLPVFAVGAEPDALTLARPQPLFPEKITATGRVQAMVASRLSARVSGHIIALGTNDAGQPLDAGMTAKSGQILFRLNETTFNNNVAVADAALALAQANLDNLRAPVRQEKLDQLRQTLVELDARLADRQRDQTRFKRLVEQEKTLPLRRLEEVQTEVAALAAQRKAAEARLREAENGPTKTEIAVAQAAVTQARAQLKIAQDDLRDATIRAPFDGLITQRFKGSGDYVSAMPIVEVFELVATDRLEADIRLPEAYYPAVRDGKTPLVLHSSLLKKSLTVPIARVVGDIDPAKGTFAVRIVIPGDHGSGLVPGAFVNVELTLNGEAHGVIVPQRAVVQSDGKSYVFVAEKGKMTRRVVTLGDRLTEGVVVTSGLSAAERVVVGAASALADGKALPEYLSSAEK